MSTNQNWHHLFKVADDIYTNYGTDAVKTTDLLKNLLSDLAHDCPNEAAALLNALSNQTIHHIALNGNVENIDYLVGQLRTTMFLSRESSENISICIFKLMGKQGTPSKEDPSTSTEQQVTPPPAPSTTKKTQTPEQKLITSGFSFLRNEKWDKATERFDQSLKTKAYPRAYIGKLMAQLHIGTESELPFTNYDILKDPNWLNAVSIANGSYKQKLERYAKQHQDYKNKKLKKPKNPIPVKNKFMHGTGIFFILGSICYALGAWFTKEVYSLIEFFMVTFTMTALGEALVLFAQDNRKVTLKRNLITFFAVSLGIPLGSMLIGFILDVISIFLLM